MHYLSDISVKNFRSIIYESFSLNSFTALVGYNNVGKSNLLFSIKWILKPSVLTVADFNNQSQEIVVSGTVKGVSSDVLANLAENHRSKIEPYCIGGSIKFRRKQDSSCTSVRGILLEIWNEENQEWDKNPTGIANAITALFPEPIEIGAMEDATEDVSKSKSSSTIGKLITQISQSMEDTYSQEIQDTLHGLKEKLEADGGDRPQELIQFDKNANKIISEMFPGVHIKLHIPTPELVGLFKTGTLKVFERNCTTGRDVSCFGHGAQRSIQMGLIRYLADIKRDTGVGNTRTLLLVDEPELYLHPQAIENIRIALKSLASENYQVVFSTHSPLMISMNDIVNSIVLRKSDDRGTFGLETLVSSVEKLIEKRPHQLKTLFELTNSSQILFSEHVILIEGKTEDKLLTKIFELLSGSTINAEKCCFICLDGSGNVKKSLEILNAIAVVSQRYKLKTM